jgi:hypothetical protein
VQATVLPDPVANLSGKRIVRRQHSGERRPEDEMVTEGERDFAHLVRSPKLSGSRTESRAGFYQPMALFHLPENH